MTKLQKTGLYVAIISAILWLVWLFAWWNYSFAACDGPYWCIGDVNYHLIHYALIALFTIWIGIVLMESSRKSLKKSCIMLLVSWLLGKIGFWLSPWFLASSCIWDCRWADIPGHIFWILWIMCVVLWFIVLFISMKHLTKSNKRSALCVVSVAALLGVFLIQANTGCQYLLKCFTKSLSTLFLCFLVISIIVCIVAWIKRYKEVKKSS